MTVQVQNFAKRNFGQSSIRPMPHFPFSTTTWWNSQEQQFPQPLFNSLSLKVGSPPQAFPEEKNAGHQPQGQDSSSTQSTDESHPTVAAIAGKNSQDPCNSSDSAQDGSYKHVEGQVKPVMFLPNPGFGVNPPQFETVNTSTAHIPYAYGDPFVNGLYTAYGPQSIEFGQIHPQMIGMAPARVPLPIELAEDGPIYVNAKQYNGILRRRQVRAKLEAQNKLLKNRKPYLHESRHLHALNRVRGSGGRFLSSKKQPPRNPTPANSDLGSRLVNQTETGKHNVTNNDSVFQQTHHVFSNISSHRGGNQGIMFNGSYGNEHSFPVVR